jgi:hypothetical protein
MGMTQPRFLQVLAAVLVALVLATTFAHVLELPAKLGYDASLYVELQKSLYQQWGPPNPAGFLEPVAIVAVVILAMTTRRNPSAFRLAVAAALVLLVAFPLLYFWRVEPANEYFRALLEGNTIPADWVSWRLRWETGHLARFVAHLTAFVLLIASLTQSVRKRHTNTLWLAA